MAKQFEDIVKEKCLEKPLINKVIRTKYDDGDTYILTIKLYKANYGDFLYWYVGCDRPYYNTTKCMLNHPFKGSEHVVEGDTNVADIVANNEITMTLMKHLAMEDEELAKYIGNKTTVGYRAKIIASIEKLWD